VQRADLGAARLGGGDVVEEHRALRVEAAAVHHEIAIGAALQIDGDRHRVARVAGAVARRRPDAAGVGDVFPALLRDRQDLLDAAVPRVERFA